jgi:hypothetical protein
MNLKIGYRGIETLSEYQVLILLHLNMAYLVVTNEGANFRAWMTRDGKVSDLAVRKNTANILYRLGLIKPYDMPNSRLFHYEITDLAKTVLSRIDEHALKNLANQVK